ncbi:MAG: hypothetical protein M1836_001248 [Candelina mexicana]|nr:MAG: hypothetical protein M1836_001248 [Candelina mexicana]
MGKSSQSKGAVKQADKARKAEKALSSVKSGAVTKPSQTPKSKSKEVAKQVAVKADKIDKKSKKKAKEPTPEPSSDDESDEDMSSGSSATSESESEVEIKKPVETKKLVEAKQSLAKANGTPKAIADKESSESSDSSDSSDSEAEPAPSKAAAAPVAKPTAVGKAGSDSGDSSGESDESDSDDEVPKKSEGAVEPAALNGALKKIAEADNSSASDSSDGSSGSESDSDESEGSSGDDDEAEAVSKKRKADHDATSVAKKSKTSAPNGEDSGTKNLFVGNLSWNVDEEWLAREFEEFGALTGTRVISDRNTGRSKGFGYVEFESAADAAAALKSKKGALIDGREVNIDFSVPRNSNAGGFQEKSNNRAQSYGDLQSPPSDTLFVGNISFEANEDILGEEFGKHGTVIGVRLPTDPESGNIKGFAYVQYASIDEAKVGLESMKGAAICGRPIRLDFSTPRPSNGDSRGGRGGGRGRTSFDRGGRGGGRGRGFGGDRGGRGGFGERGRGARGGGSINRGGFGDFQGKKKTF